MNRLYNSLRFNLNKAITAIGEIGIYDISNEVSTRFVIEGASGANVIEISYRLNGQNDWILLDTLTGSINQLVIVDTCDAIKLECTTYGSTGSSVKIIACSFNRE